MTINELIDRLKAATGPDRELDAEIWLLITPGATRVKRSYTHKATGRLCEIDETRDATRYLVTRPCYTASIDAALTIGAEELKEYNCSQAYRPISTCYAWVYRASGEMGKLEKGASPALAICIARLTALSALRKTQLGVFLAEDEE